VPDQPTAHDPLAAAVPAPRPATSRPTPRVVTGRVTHASRVGGTLLLVGWHGEETDLAAAQAVPHVAWHDARSMAFPVALPDGRTTAVTGFLAAVAAELPHAPVVVRLGRVSLLVLPEQLREVLVDVRALAWEGLGSLEDGSRRRAAAFLAGVAPPPGQSVDRRSVARELTAVHDVLRPALPSVTIDAAQARGLFVDQLYALDECAFYVRGWLRDAEADVTSLVMVAPEGATADVVGTLARYPRPDVDAFYAEGGAGEVSGPTGFLATFVLPAPSRLGHGWKVEMRNAAGHVVEAPVPAVVDDPLAARAAVLNDLAHDLAPDAPFLREHAHPAMTRLVAHRTGPEEVAAVHAFGRAPEAPDVTVLVPLYKRVDFVEHQLAQFVHDPAMRAVDLVYVLDSPELAEQTLRAAEGLARMYDVPFRLVVLRRNLGFADANNVGASFARGRLLLLLNSDVLPDRPGWLETLVDAHDRLPEVGAVGAKLLYEDDSLQHAGMFFDRPEGALLWTNGHYFKGLHKSFPPSTVEREVPAVTGACLLLARELWEQVGGLCGGYVQGDYEDSDLCLRLRALGRRNWYVPSAELYHLEGRSYPDELRRAVGRYNTWLQTHLWDAQLADAMRDVGAAPEL
jgi:GT2 family glycosyltransferase